MSVLAEQSYSGRRIARSRQVIRQIYRIQTQAHSGFGFSDQSVFNHCPDMA